VRREFREHAPCPAKDSGVQAGIRTASGGGNGHDFHHLEHLDCHDRQSRNGAERKTFITYSRALRNVLCRGLLLALHPAENTCLPAVHHRPPSPAAAIATGEHSEKGRAGDNRLQ
jgi:hypothetical protein